MAEQMDGIAPPDAVTDSSVEARIEAKAIGERIRRLRLKRSLGLVELGRRTGLSASFLSQLETGRVVPTLRNLSRIALVFQKDLSYFFEERSKSFFRTSRTADRIRLRVGEKDAPFMLAESLSNLIPNRTLVPCMAEFLPLPEGREKAFHPHSFSGQEFVYVLYGSLSLATRTELQLLEAGDVAWIDGSVERHYRRHGEGAARAMIVTCPVSS